MLHKLSDMNRLGFDVECEPQALNRKVLFTGAGWYSLDDDGVYYYGIKPTYSRIKIKEKQL